MAEAKGNAATGGAGGGNEVLDLLKQISADLSALKEDVTVLGKNDEKLNGRLQTIETGAGGPSAGVVSQELDALRKQIAEIDARPVFQRDTKKAKEKHEAALRAAGEREREADVRILWHPQLDPAKRDGQPLCRKVTSPADVEEAQALGYLGSLEEAAEALHKAEPARFKTVNMAKVALANEEAKIARRQIASIPGAPQPQAPAA